MSQPAKSNGNMRELMALRPPPSFSLAEAKSILDIEIQAEQLLAYIDKLTTLADRACSTAIRQNETTHLIEENRRNEIISLRHQLDHQTSQLREQQLALSRLEQESRAKIAILETRLEHRSEEAELQLLRSENEKLANQLQKSEMLAKETQSRMQQLVPVSEDVATLKLQLAERDDVSRSKSAAIKNMEIEYRAKIVSLEQDLRNTQSELRNQEARLREKEALIQAAATKEAEIGNLIKRLSTECSNLGKDLVEKNRRLAEIESKQIQPLADGNIWRRVVGRLQEDPQ